MRDVAWLSEGYTMEEMFQNRKRYGGMRDDKNGREIFEGDRFQNRKRYGGMRDNRENIREGQNLVDLFQNRKRYGGMRDREVSLMDGWVRVCFKTASGMEACATFKERGFQND